MKTAPRILRAIEKLPLGQVIGYADIGIGINEYQAAAKAFERLVASGTIKRASTGLFYKPKQTVFGELKPAEDELLRPYLYEKGHRIAYITGLSLYNKMGLTTQVPGIISIASRGKRIIAKVGNIRIQAVKSYAEVSDDNYYLLELLDAIKDFKKIQDINRKGAIKILSDKINKLSRSDKQSLIKIAIGYPPRAKALLGALLENMQQNPSLFMQLRQELNPLSSYELGISEAILPTASKWNIA